MIITAITSVSRLVLFLLVGGGTLTLWFIWGGMGILIMWFLLCVAGTLVVGSAALLMRRLWSAHPYAPPWTRLFGVLTLLFIVLDWAAVRSMQNYQGGAITPVQAAFTALAFLIMLAVIDVAATLQHRLPKEGNT